MMPYFLLIICQNSKHGTWGVQSFSFWKLVTYYLSHHILTIGFCQSKRTYFSIQIYHFAFEDVFNIFLWCMLSRQNLHLAPGFTFKEVNVARASTSKVVCCHFSSDGKLLATGGHDKKVIVKGWIIYF